MQQILLDFLLKQLPVIVVLGIFCYFMYQYFTKVIDSKDQYFTKVIDAKDKTIDGQREEIKALNERLLQLTTRCLQSTDKNNEILLDVRDLIIKLLAPR